MRLAKNIWKKGSTDDTPPEGSEESVFPSNTEKGRRRRRKPEEMLASVVQESTVNAAVDLLNQNDPFALPGANSWVALALPVENIGGLSKKQKKDEAKGSLIELINHDYIQTITTRQLLDEEVLGIIPTVQTLERMGEYSLLTSARYYWMVLSPSKDRQKLVVSPVRDEEAYYSEAEAISNGSRSLADRLPHVWAWAEAMNFTPSMGTANRIESNTDEINLNSGGSASVPQPTLSPTEEIDPRTRAVAADSTSDESIVYEKKEDDSLDGREHSTDTPDEGLSDDITSPAFEDLLEEGSDEYEDEDEVDDEDEDGGFITESEGEQTPAWQQYVEQNRDRNFTEEQVRESIARRFLPDGLDLKIPLDEFEATFDTRSPAVQLEFSEKFTDWLGEQVALMAEQANTELKKLHRDHRRELRQLFVETMSLHAESVMREVDDQREGSIYQKLSAAAEKEFADLRAKAPAEISAQRRDITQRYEENATDRADVAAAQAKQIFWDRFRPELERKLSDVAHEIEHRNEERYAHQRQLVLDMRRNDAHTRMQLGTTRTFQLLSEREVKQKEAEMKLLKKWNSALTRFIDNNRRNDIFRAEALSEQLSLDNRIEEMQAEHAHQMKNSKIDREELRCELEDKLERSRVQAEAYLREQEKQWEREKARKNEELESAKNMYVDLHSQTKTITDEMHRQYQGRIEELKGNKDSYVDELERTNQAQGRFNKILMFLVAVVALVSIAAGVIIGWTVGMVG